MAANSMLLAAAWTAEPFNREAGEPIVCCVARALEPEMYAVANADAGSDDVVFDLSKLNADTGTGVATRDASNAFE